MRQSSTVTSFVVLTFVVLLNRVDESDGIIIPIIKPDLRYLIEKKKTLLSFLNVQAILQMLGQIVNLSAILRHFGLAPAPSTAASQKGSLEQGSANQLSVMPPPASAQGTQVTLGEEMNDFIEAEGEAVTEVGTFERESNTENKDQQESREEGVDIEITDNLDNAKVNNAEGGAATSQSGEAETTTMAIAEMRTNEIGSIDTERRWKLDNIRRRLMFLKRRGIF